MTTFLSKIYAHKRANCEPQSSRRWQGLWWASKQRLLTQSNNAQFYISTHYNLIYFLFELFSYETQYINALYLHILFFLIFLIFFKSFCPCVCLLLIHFVHVFFNVSVSGSISVITKDKVLFKARFKILILLGRNTPVLLKRLVRLCCCFLCCLPSSQLFVFFFYISCI